MTREFRSRSSCAIFRIRIASSMRCRMTGCSADSMKKIQKMSSTVMRSSWLGLFASDNSGEGETRDAFIDVARPLAAARRLQQTRENDAGNEAADMGPPGDTAAGERCGPISDRA